MYSVIIKQWIECLFLFISEYSSNKQHFILNYNLHINSFSSSDMVHDWSGYYPVLSKHRSFYIEYQYYSRMWYITITSWGETIYMSFAITDSLHVFKMGTAKHNISLKFMCFYFTQTNRQKTVTENGIPATTSYLSRTLCIFTSNAW